MDMLNEFPFSDEWKSARTMTDLFDRIHMLTTFPVSDDMNQYMQYMAQWLIALEALRQLWEAGKVSQMKSPFYEPVERRANR
jgi:hypothetical protein